MASGTDGTTQSLPWGDVCDFSKNHFNVTRYSVLAQNGSTLTQYDNQGNSVSDIPLPGDVTATFSQTAGNANNTIHYQLHDWLGTRRMQTDSNGNPEMTCVSGPFGDMPVPCVGLSNKQFTGKERDTESGLDYFGARYCGSNMGRFMSPDPFLNSGHPSDPQTWNRYTYALNNPLKIVGPTGLYNLSAGCLQDATCAANAKLLRDGLAALNKALDDPKVAGALGEAAVVRLSQGLAAMGTENDGNNVGVNFAPISGTAAATTDASDAGGTGHYNFTVTFDPSKNKSSNDYAINGDHEGIPHMTTRTIWSTRPQL